MNLVAELDAILLSMLALLYAIAAHPTSARCSPGWYINGVRPDGEYGCRPSPPLEPAVRGHEQDAPARHDIEIRSRVYCTGGAQPIIVDDRTVGCQR